MKEDVKKKKLLPAPREDAGVVTYIQPHRSLLDTRLLRINSLET
jgi:hypothetical protein